MDILVNVANQKLKIATNLKSLVAGTQEFVRFVFNTSGDWDGLATFAQFRQNGVAYNQYLDDDKAAYLPSEIGVGTCTVMLYGSNGNTIATTNYLTLTIDENILVSDAESTDISLSLYNQLVSKVNSLSTWNEQNAADLIAVDKDLQQQINQKANANDLATEISRAKAAEKTKEIRSESVFHDMIFAESGNTAPIIASSVSSNTITQYNTMRIPIVIYHPGKLTTDATLAVDGVNVAEWNDVDRTVHYWNYTPSDFGTKVLTITCGATVKTITLTVNKLEIDNEEISGYAFRLKASDIATNEALRAWTSNGVDISFSDNFDWNNGGIQTETDENGNIRQFICVKAGTTATINYELFGNDPRTTGKNFKVIFKPVNSRDYDAMFLDCMDGGIGIQLGANGGTASSEQNTLSVQYAEGSYTEFEFDVRPDSTFRYIQTYLDGVLTSTNVYATDDNFTQANKKKIVIGSNDCDVYIYMVKAYETYLTPDNHIENFIADAPNAQEMVLRYERNDILADNGEISYEKLAAKNPEARIHLWNIPRMTEGKKDYVDGCSYQQIYNAGDARHQLTAENVRICIQGTSSVNYKESGANTDGKFLDGFTDGNGQHIDAYSMEDDSIPVNYFNTKVNVASCENINNMCLAEWYNRFQPYKTLWRQKNPKARDCMEHHMGVQFIRDQSHGLFSDDNYHMYAICNMGNSKKNLNVFHDADNPLECCIETLDNNSTHCLMLDPAFSVADLDSEDFFEFRYPDSPTNEMKQAFVNFVRWMASSNPSNATGAKLASAVTYGAYTFKGTGQDGWGKLKSGAGWIYLGNPNYCTIGKSLTTTTKPAPSFTAYKVKIKADVLNIRKGAGTNYGINGTIKDKGVYTIVAESDGADASKWGKLKSGAGWISLDWCKKV